MSWLHTIVRKLSTQKVISSWRMKMEYQSYTTCKKSFQVSNTINTLINTCVHAIIVSYFLYKICVPCLAIMLWFLLDEWNNFLERINCKNDSEVWETEENILQLRHWVSLRGQTLCRTGILRFFYYFFLPSNSLSFFSGFNGYWCCSQRDDVLPKGFEASSFPWHGFWKW